MPLIEIDPIVPTTDPEGSGLGGARIEVDAEAGTLTWTPDHRRTRATGGQRTAPLPGRGAGAVAKLAVVRYRVGTDPTFSYVDGERMLFVGADGRVLWMSRQYIAGTLLEAWPMERLRSLENAGIDVTTGTFNTTRELDAAYPGAAPHGKWLSPPRSYLLGVAGAVLIVAIVLLVMVLSGS